MDAASFASTLEQALRGGLITPAQALAASGRGGDAVRALLDVGAVTPGQAKRLRVGPAPPTAGYECVRELGRGGMGVVSLARKAGEAEPRFAVKRVREGGPRSSGNLKRLLREAEVCRRLDHPNIARFVEVCEDAEGLLLVFEYIPGRPLSAVLCGRSLPADESLRIAIGILEGLSHAHERGIVHRDLKPENVLLREDGTPVLLDFGLGRLASSGEMDTLTRTGIALGTAAYMSPEQIRDSRSVDARSDVFSFGVLLYRMLGGTHPFATRSLLETLDRVRSEEPVSPACLQPVPEPLAAVCMKCLAKDPFLRYPSAKEALEDLRACRDGRPVTASPPLGARRVGAFLAKAFALLAAIVVPAVFPLWYLLGHRMTWDWDRSSESVGVWAGLVDSMVLWILSSMFLWAVVAYRYRSRLLLKRHRRRASARRNYPGSTIVTLFTGEMLFPDVCACCAGPSDCHEVLSHGDAWGPLGHALCWLWDLRSRVPLCAACRRGSKWARKRVRRSGVLVGAIAVTVLGLAGCPFAFAQWVSPRHPFWGLYGLPILFALSWITLRKVYARHLRYRPTLGPEHCCAERPLGVMRSGMEAVTFEAWNPAFVTHLLAANPGRVLELDSSETGPDAPKLES